MAVDLTLPDVTTDAVLGGRLKLMQPRRGHRVGHDAILLAAATDARHGEHVVDLGSGVGGAGLALAARVDALFLTLIEIDPELAEIARANARLNGKGDRVQVLTLDAAAPGRAFAETGLKAGMAARVMMNPPFNDPRRQRRSPHPGRAAAHHAEPGALNAWCKTAARLLAPKGALTLIWRAEGLVDVLSSLERWFGEIVLLPVHPRPNASAIRIIVRAVKGSRTPVALLPAFVLNDENGRPTSQTEAVLRHAAALSLRDEGKASKPAYA